MYWRKSGCRCWCEHAAPEEWSIAGAVTLGVRSDSDRGKRHDDDCGNRGMFLEDEREKAKGTWTGYSDIPSRTLGKDIKTGLMKGKRVGVPYKELDDLK